MDIIRNDKIVEIKENEIIKNENISTDIIENKKDYLRQNWQKH